MDMNLSKLWEMVKDRETGRVAVHGVAKSRTQQQQERPQAPRVPDISFWRGEWGGGGHMGGWTGGIPSHPSQQQASLWGGKQESRGRAAATTSQASF